MSILKKISDVLKEVFWIKPTKKRKSSVRKKSAKKSPKKSVKKNPKSIPKIKKSNALTKVEKPAKIVKEKPAKKSKVSTLDPNLVKVGEITHYFERIKVCVVKITHGSILIGDKLTIVGKKTKFVQKVWSMQIESLDVKVAKKGELIGLKVDKAVQVGDIVYK